MVAGEARCTRKCIVTLTVAFFYFLRLSAKCLFMFGRDACWYFIALKFRGIKISRFRGRGQKTAKLKCREKCIFSMTAKLKCRENFLFFNREILLRYLRNIHFQLSSKSFFLPHFYYKENTDLKKASNLNICCYS